MDSFETNKKRDPIMVFLSLSLSLSRHCILAPCCGNKNVAHTGLRTKIATTEIVRKYVTGWNREKKKKKQIVGNTDSSHFKIRDRRDR